MKHSTLVPVMALLTTPAFAGGNPGDFDGDGDVDLVDFGVFQTFFTGPQCPQIWLPLAGPAGNGMNGSVYTLGTYDDGSGPALYAGGAFDMAGGVQAIFIGRWDGSAWSPLVGPSGSGYTGASIRALATYDDGSGPALHVGGPFGMIGGVQANFIAKWDGTDWSPLVGPSGIGVNNWVLALNTHDDGTGPALYVGGRFSMAGGIVANAVAKWDGTTWSPLAGPAGNGMNMFGEVSALTTYDDGTDPALYAGGFFNTAGGVSANNIAKWNGVAWSPLAGPAGNGVNGQVYALTTYDDGTGLALYAGGTFPTAGGVTANRIARWNGTGWSPVVGPSGNGLTGDGARVNALTTHERGTGQALLAGGVFALAGGVTANNIASWTAAGGWSALGSGTDSEVLALHSFPDGPCPALYLGGQFTMAGGVTANHVAKRCGVVP